MIEAGRRYPDLEMEFVLRVCSRAGMVTNQKQSAIQKLVDHQQERMGIGRREYGDTQFWHIPLIGEGNSHGKSLVTELQEEAADILGWGSLLSVRLQERGWNDLATRLEVATTPVIGYGDKLKHVEQQIAQRLRR